MSDTEGDSAWQVFELPELMKSVTGQEPKFREFLRSPTLSLSLYHLPAGATDMQAPHYEDEVYVVLAGRATLRIAGREQLVSTGSVLFVQATTEHSFFDIEEDLTVMAIFGEKS